MFSILKLNRLKSIFKYHRMFIKTINPRLPITEETEYKRNTKRRNDSKKNLSAVLFGKNDLRFVRNEIAKLKENDVLIAIDCVGLCDDDLHLCLNGMEEASEKSEPATIGHEASGVIVDTGSNVKKLKIGDRISIGPGQPCYTCQKCRSGHYNICSNIRYYDTASRNDDGMLTRYYKHDENFCFKLPEHVSMEEGALLQSLAQGVAICRRAKISLDSRVVIIGCNTAAIATYLLAEYMGAERLLIVDKYPNRLEHAKMFDANTFELQDNYEPCEIANEIHKYMAGNVPDKCIDFITTNESIRLAMHITRQGGLCAIPHNILSDDIVFPLKLAVKKEIDVVCVNNYGNDYPLALATLSSGKLNVESLITHHFNFEDLQLALEVAGKHCENSYCKIMIHVQPEDKNNY